jgi:GAF domain-containing protein
MDDVVAVTVEPTAAEQPVLRPAASVTVGPLGVVAELAQVLGTAQRVSDVARAAVLAAGQALDAAHVSIARLDPEDGTITVLVDGLGPSPHRAGAAPGMHRLCRHVLGRALLRGDGTWRYRAGQHPAHDTAELLLTATGAGACMVTPIVVGGRVWGGLYATRRCG